MATPAASRSPSPGPAPDAGASAAPRAVKFGSEEVREIAGSLAPAPDASSSQGVTADDASGAAGATGD
eukprot:10369737-Alexandrium_andersonii.AAC.1